MIIKTIKPIVLILVIFLSLQLFSGCESNSFDSIVPPSPSQSQTETSSNNFESVKPTQEFQGDLTVNFIDVGQGDSVFIILPNKETILIDAGNQGDANEICAFVKSHGIETITYLIATHPHSDHIGGMTGVVQSLGIENVYMPKAAHTTATFENLLDAISDKGLSIQTAKAGKVIFDQGNLKAEFIAPIKDSYTNLNLYSAVVKLKYNNKVFLFMGDAEQENESELLANGFDVSADVIKVGHHGSKTSSTKNFIKAVHPSVAVISVGKNSYGHPNTATIGMFNELNIDVWRTDEKGTVIVICDGVNISIKSTKISAQPNAPPDTSKSDSNPTIEENKSVMVYITKTGTKYHADGCRYLNKSGIPIELEDINTNKYSPCSVCNPPR